MKLKNNPHKILTQQLAREAAVRAATGAAEGPAAWFGAVSRHPPAAPALASVVPAAVGHFGHAAATAARVAAQLGGVERSARRKMRAAAPAYTKTAPAIAFPEDTLRAAFYAAHPAERLRPRPAREDPADLKARAAEERAPEFVISNTMRLAAQDGGPSVAEAYSQSLKQFYLLRQEQEKSEHAAAVRKRTELLKRVDAIMKREDVTEEEVELAQKTLVYSPVAWFAEKEEEQLAESKAYLDKLDKEREEKRALAEKMAQFEARNMARGDAPAAEAS